MGLNRQGKRIERKKALKQAKVHKKEIYKIFEELEFLATVLRVEGIELNEDNIVDEVSKRSDIKLGAFEKAILLNYYNKEANEDTNS